MRYELSYIIKGDLEEAKEKEISEDLINFISKTGENPKGVTQPKIQPLAYPIKKQTQGYWGALELGLKPEKLPELEKKLKENKDIIRFMITKKTIKREKEEKKEKKEKKEKTSAPPKAKPKVKKQKKADIKDLDEKLDEILKEV